MFCQKCGKQIDDNTKFCTSCGAPTEPSSPAVQEYGQPRQASYVAPQKSNTALIITIIAAAFVIVAAIAAAVVILTNKEVPPIDDIQTEQSSQENSVPEEADTAEEPPHEMTFEEAQGIAAGYSTSEHPQISDFDWYVPSIGTGIAPGFLQSATPITNHTLVEGGWKLAIIWDPQRVRNAYCWDVANCDIWDLGGDSVSLNAKHYILYEPDPGYTTDFSNVPDDYYSGSWNGPSFYVTIGGGSITINGFYEYNGKQYAIGSATTQDGTAGEVALVRP